MTTLIIYVSALFLGFLIVVIVALAYAIVESERAKETKNDERWSARW